MCGWVGCFCLFGVMSCIVVVLHVGVFECFPNPSNSDIQVYRIVNECDLPAYVYITLYGHTQLARGPRFIPSTEELTLHAICTERHSFGVAAKQDYGYTVPRRLHPSTPPSTASVYIYPFVTTNILHSSLILSARSRTERIQPSVAVYRPCETSQHCKSPLVEAASEEKKEEKKNVKLTGLNLVVEAVSVQFVGRCYKEE